MCVGGGGDGGPLTLSQGELGDSTTMGTSQLQTYAVVGGAADSWGDRRRSPHGTDARDGEIGGGRLTAPTSASGGGDSYLFGATWRRGES